MKIEIKSILYPTDFSDLSLKALKYAVSFADAYGARLHCIHVIDEAYQYWMSLGPESVPVGPAVEDLSALAKEQLSKFAESHLGGLTPRPVTEVLVGRPFVEINQYAKDHGIDLIVIATHGRSGLTHALMGSTAEKVIRKAPCPVLSIRDPEHDFVKSS